MWNFWRDRDYSSFATHYERINDELVQLCDLHDDLTAVKHDLLDIFDRHYPTGFRYFLLIFSRIIGIYLGIVSRNIDKKELYIDANSDRYDEISDN